MRIASFLFSVAEREPGGSAAFETRPCRALLRISSSFRSTISPTLKVCEFIEAALELGRPGEGRDQGFRHSRGSK